MKQACYVTMETEHDITHDGTTTPHFVLEPGLRPVSRRLPGEVVINDLRKSYGFQYISAVIGARDGVLSILRGINWL